MIVKEWKRGKKRESKRGREWRRKREKEMKEVWEIKGGKKKRERGKEDESFLILCRLVMIHQKVTDWIVSMSICVTTLTSHLSPPPLTHTHIHTHSLSLSLFPLFFRLWKMKKRKKIWWKSQLFCNLICFCYFANFFHFSSFDWHRQQNRISGNAKKTAKTLMLKGDNKASNSDNKIDKY